MPILVLSEADVERCLPAAECIDLMSATLVDNTVGTSIDLNVTSFDSPKWTGLAGGVTPNIRPSFLDSSWTSMPCWPRRIRPLADQRSAVRGLKSEDGEQRILRK